MKHTFLFEEGDWAGEGHMSDSEGNRLAVTARLEVRHEPGAWSQRQEMTVAADPPVGIRTESHIVPFGPGRDSTVCTSEHSVLGGFTGTIAVVGDSLLTVARSEEGQSWSMESLMQLSETRYLSRGVYSSGGKLVSSWDLEMNRIQ